MQILIMLLIVLCKIVTIGSKRAWQRVVPSSDKCRKRLTIVVAVNKMIFSVLRIILCAKSAEDYMETTENQHVTSHPRFPVLIQVDLGL